MRRLVSTGLFVSALLAACATTPSARPQLPGAALGQPTSAVMVASLAVPATAPSNLKAAAIEPPLKLWAGLKPAAVNAAQTTDGYTLTFEDFYGAPMAYATQVSRDGQTDPALMLQAYEQQPKDARGLHTEGLKDQKDWTIGTYVSGANSEQLVLGRTMYGFPLLEGLYGPDAQANGVVNHVDHLLMPDNNTFWAALDDGRVWDLSWHQVVPAEAVSSARQRYEQVMQARAQATLESATSRAWATALGAGKLTLKPQHQTTTTNCYTWYILWFPQTRCANHYVVYLNDAELFPAMSAYSSGGAWYRNYDNWQDVTVDSSGNYHYSGCSPTAMSELLLWFHYYRGIATGRQDFLPGGVINLTDFAAWQWEMHNAMGTSDAYWYTDANGHAWNMGSTYAFSIRGGAETVLNNHGIPLKGGQMLIDAISAVSQDNSWIKNTIRDVMGVRNYPLVMSAIVSWPSNAHTGIARSFVIDDDVHAIYGTLVYPPNASYEGSLVVGDTMGSGVLWLEPR